MTPAIIDDLRNKSFPVLDKGHIIFLDGMGSDDSIADDARSSYGSERKVRPTNRDLIRRLMRDHHTSPFEMAEIKVHLKLPIYVARQWWRHRTANLNELSGRYVEMPDEFQRTQPDGWRLQSKDNKQGSDGFLPMDGQASSDGNYHSTIEAIEQDHSAQTYKERLAYGIAREQARKDLPLSTYTQAVWKCDLHNLFHFLKLRMAPDAQLEIRQYAAVLFEQIVKPLFPIAAEAFEDYRLNSMMLSGLDISVIASIGSVPAEEDPVDFYSSSSFVNKRERDECRVKLVRLGLIPPVR